MIDPDKRYKVFNNQFETNRDGLEGVPFTLFLSYNDLLKIINEIHNQMLKEENALKVNQLFAMHY